MQLSTYTQGRAAETAACVSPNRWRWRSQAVTASSSGRPRNRAQAGGTSIAGLRHVSPRIIGSYVERSGGGRTVFGIAVSACCPGDPPDSIDLWRLEQAIEEHVIALLGPGSTAAASVVASDPGFGDAPEWLIERATPDSVRKFSNVAGTCRRRIDDDRPDHE